MKKSELKQLIKVKIYIVENCYGNFNKVYIGKTINSRENNHKRTYGSQIKYSIIDEVNSILKKDWKPLECFWIEQFRQWGFDLQNKNEGGGGPEKYTDEQKSKMRKPKSSNLGYKKTWTKERRIQQSKINKGKKQSKNWKEKRAKIHCKPINCITPSKEIIIFESATHCNKYFTKLFNKKTCFGAINNSLRDNKIVNKGKLKNYKFEYVEV